MIKTSHKDKLPQGMSYPVGAEILSNALVGVPQYEKLSISFNIRDECWVSSYNQKIKEKGEIAVLIVRHFLSYHFDGWQIRISSVPSLHKKQVSEQLITQVLPELRQRLIKVGSEAETFDFSASLSLATGEMKISR